MAWLVVGLGFGSAGGVPLRDVDFVLVIQECEKPDRCSRRTTSRSIWPSRSCRHNALSSPLPVRSQHSSEPGPACSRSTLQNPRKE